MTKPIPSGHFPLYIFGQSKLWNAPFILTTLLPGKRKFPELFPYSPLYIVFWIKKTEDTGKNIISEDKQRKL